VEATAAANLPLPRVEILAERLGLDGFEKKVILLLIGKTVSPVVKTLIDTLDGGGSRVSHPHPFIIILLYMASCTYV